MQYLLDTSICVFYLRGKYILTLVTDNSKHFKRLEGIKLENWIKRKENFDN